jgi:hypothetical protein
VEADLQRNDGRATTGGAKSGALSDRFTGIDPALQRLIDGWPSLREPIRRAILALVENGR